MAEVEKTPLGDAVREIVDLKKIKEIIGLMCNGSMEEQIIALDKLPAILNALSRFNVATAAKAVPKANADELDQV